jgi:hypothetical protein
MEKEVMTQGGDLTWNIGVAHKKVILSGGRRKTG